MRHLMVLVYILNEYLNQWYISYYDRSHALCKVTLNQEDVHYV